MEHNELALLYDLSCQDGKGKVLQQNIPQCFPLTARGPTWARTVAVLRGTAPSRLLRLPAQESHHACPPHRQLLWKGNMAVQRVLRLDYFPERLKEGYSPAAASLQPRGPCPRHRVAAGLDTVKAALVLGW